MIFQHKVRSIQILGSVTFEVQSNTIVLQFFTGEIQSFQWKSMQSRIPCRDKRRANFTRFTALINRMLLGLKVTSVWTVLHISLHYCWYNRLFVCTISEKCTVVQLIFIGRIQIFQQESTQFGISCEGKGFLNGDFESGSSWSNKLSIDNIPFCQRYTKCWNVILLMKKALNQLFN